MSEWAKAWAEAAQDKIEHIKTALVHLRVAMLAAKNGAPTLPSLLESEEALVRALFDDKWADEYLKSDAAKFYGR